MVHACTILKVQCNVAVPDDRLMWISVGTVPGYVADECVMVSNVSYHQLHPGGS